MGFVIQVCDPRVLRRDATQVADVAEAVQTIFPMITENAFLLWNGIPVTISYKYDLSVLIDDLLPLLRALLDSERGSYNVAWGSDTFMADWALDWAGGQITIVSAWRSAGGYEDLLNSRSRLQMARGSFLREWKTILVKIINSIEMSGVEVSDEANLELLRVIERQIPEAGYLYAAT